MKLILPIVLFITLSSVAYSQKTKTINLTDVCETVKIAYTTVDPVSDFKSNLHVKLKIDMLSDGLNEQQVDVDIVQEIEDETDIFQISKKVAISVSVARVKENGNKFYVYKIHLFRKIDGCWEDASIQNTWQKFNLGVVTGGYAYGSKGTSTYLGFSGTIIIE
ncbi:MAG: hypothetical protein H6586_02215 [Flavobacteriales bacterium]|nr:hypothetical protein [Flavobacteriales bacterium]